MTKIIGISGKKQSGKNTAANYITGSIFKDNDMIKDFYISEGGQLVIHTSNSKGESGWGELNLLRKDEEFLSYADNLLWPYTKIYHFADYLKQISVDLFDLTEQQVYGTDDDKNTPTNYDMTAREFLQYFGTEVMRKIKDTVWVDCTIKKIFKEQTGVAIIPDVRFANEIAAIKNAGGVVIRLTRDPFNSKHECETALDQDKYDWSNFDYIIDNHSNTIEQFTKNIKLLSKLWS